MPHFLRTHARFLALVGILTVLAIVSADMGAPRHPSPTGIGVLAR